MATGSDGAREAGPRGRRLLAALVGLYMCAVAVALEVSVGKTNVVTALNGSDVLLPCVFTTCIGFWDLVFTWSYNDSTTLCRGFIKSKAVEPKVQSENFRVVFVGSTTGKDNNISIVLLSVDFSDAGKYTCHVKNPREKGNAEHSSYIELQVVHKLVVADNTLTLIIVAVVGGLIGLLILFMVVKKVVLFIIKKTQDGKKECLVSSSGNDNTENGLAGSKAEQKVTPKA
ncbi:sodium channel subunit beta-4 [Alligator mississippiensis]|uniref:sodium channel subunit beta-4 n=1 Tax=Alligator mississippiensis TaxID=8496 RepID=UPI0028777341|nr:sodium channel subunit beta-4 [Alligator mississippiensis]